MGSYLRKILFQYNFRLRQHQDDVVRLLYLANCFHPQTFIKDLNTTGHSLAQIERASQIARQFSDNELKNLENFNPDLILHKLFFDPYSSWPEKTHNW